MLPISTNSFPISTKPLGDTNCVSDSPIASPTFQAKSAPHFPVPDSYLLPFRKDVNTGAILTLHLMIHFLFRFIAPKINVCVPAPTIQDLIDGNLLHPKLVSLFDIEPKVKTCIDSSHQRVSKKDILIVEDPSRPNTIKLQSFYGNIYRIGFFYSNPGGYLLTCDIATFNHRSKLVNVGVFWKPDPLIGRSGSSFFRAVAICLPLDGSSTDEYKMRGF
ncbi:hypothetical protein M5689_006760 [Euphorbia peplus]|nr:hypothetical protein M5689_006760 [Euphorbia peplus]